MTSLEKNKIPWRLFDIPHVIDESGDLCIVERSDFLPFEFERFIYVHDIPSTAKRAEHAHRQINELVIALAGGVEVVLDNGEISETFKLENPKIGLFVPRLVWVRLESFKPGTVYLVVTSGGYDEREYIRDYKEFLTLVNNARG